jgi:hypothetical protein
MTDIQQGNAIRARIWLGGQFIARDPVPVQMTPKRYEAKTPLSNLSKRIDRAQGVPGLPNILTSYEFTLPWSDLREPAVLEHIDQLDAVGQPFGLGLWKQEYDFFDLDGTGTIANRYLRRRQLLQYATPPAAPADFPTRAILYDSAYGTGAATPTELAVIPKASADIDTSGPGPGEAWVENEGRQVGGLWLTKVRVGATSFPDAHDCLVFIYLPLYTVAIKDGSPRSYAQALREPRTLVLEEVS